MRLTSQQALMIHLSVCLLPLQIRTQALMRVHQALLLSHFPNPGIHTLKLLTQRYLLRRVRSLHVTIKGVGLCSIVQPL